MSTMQNPREDSPHTYYARPVTAMRLNPANLVEAARWCGGRVETDDMPNGGRFVLVPHLDGAFHARPGRWLIQDSDGKFRNEVEEDFQATYDINPPRPPGPIPRGVSESAVPR